MMNKLTTATYKKYTLHFKQASGTSRGVLHSKDSYFIFVKNPKNPSHIAIGECSILKGLSIDDRPEYEQKLSAVCQNIQHYLQPENRDSLVHFPSIQFALEIIQKELTAQKPHILFASAFTQGQAQQLINGLIWMGDVGFMKQQIKEKLQLGFDCIKIKIGAIDFNTELGLLKAIRQEFAAGDLQLRVDANGAFLPKDALEKLKRLSDFDLHSIEQPIGQNQWQAMAQLCQQTPLPIVLDEELIGIFDPAQKALCLQTIAPQYIILKPSLIGGFAACENWITLAKKYNIGWWATSALESNIGLNAIAQWTFIQKNPLHQGLGTGQLYTNNFDCPLHISRGKIGYNPDQKWNLSAIL